MSLRSLDTRTWFRAPLRQVAKQIDRWESPSPGVEYRLIGVKWWGGGVHIHDTVGGFGNQGDTAPACVCGRPSDKQNLGASRERCCRARSLRRVLRLRRVPHFPTRPFTSLASVASLVGAIEVFLGGMRGVVSWHERQESNQTRAVSRHPNPSAALARTTTDRSLAR